MFFGPDELRLFWAMLLCAAPLIAAYRLMRKLVSPVEAAGDALLLTYLGQYLAVGLAGCLGCLTPLAITIEAGVFTVALALLSRLAKAAPEQKISAAGRMVISASALFVLGYVAAVVYFQALQPPTATDALTYHLPAAVQWLQDRRIGLFQTWFFNPANTYSPLAGSMFAAWLMVPLHNDVLARFMQIGPLFLIFFCILELSRQCKAPIQCGAIAAVAAVLSRPFISEALLAKDDLFLAAFFLAAVAGLAPKRMRQRCGAARVGIAIGLMLATKYTVLLSLPIFLLALDAPARAGWKWRDWMCLIVPIVLLSGPWYVRNWILTGNPLFPTTVNIAGVIHFRGLFTPTRSQSLATLGGAWKVLTGGYYSLPPLVGGLLGLAWVGALACWASSLPQDPLRRLVIVGPALGLVIFVLFSPYGEVRFVLPVLALLFAASAFCLPAAMTTVLTVAIAVAAVGTSFSGGSDQILQFTMAGVVVAAGGLAIRWFETNRLPSAHGRPLLSGACVFLATILIWISWGDFLDQYRSVTDEVWQSPMTYGPLGKAWTEVRSLASPAATIAYANEFMIYPLYGFDYGRKVVYAPVCCGQSIAGLVFPARLSGERIAAAAIAATDRPFDREAWMENLRSSGAEYLFVGRNDEAPEIGMAEQDPAQFCRIFENQAVIIYRLQLR